MTTPTSLARTTQPAGAGFALLDGAYRTAACRVSGHDVSGWTTIVVGLRGRWGRPLLSLSVAGESMGHIAKEWKAFPVYTVQRKLSHSLQKGDL